LERDRHQDGQKIKRWKKSLPAILLLSPILLVIIGFFIVPMLFVLYLSFIETDGLDTANAVYSIGNFTKFFTDPFYLSSMWVTIKISILTVLVCLILGYPVALTMSKASTRVRGFLTLLVASPLLISVVVRNFGFYLLLLPNGTINNLLTSLGITDSPIQFLFTETSVIIGLSNAFLPYMILSIATNLYSIDPSLNRASAILGASPLRSFLSITLPLSLPGIVSGIVLVFSLSMSSYVTPALMGGPNVRMIPSLAYDQITHLLNWTYGSAISFVLLGVTLFCVTVFTRILERSRFKEVFR
jgi:putative spermidine/putrescine transport system permease protein